MSSLFLNSNRYKLILFLFYIYISLEFLSLKMIFYQGTYYLFSVIVIILFLKKVLAEKNFPTFDSPMKGTTFIIVLIIMWKIFTFSHSPDIVQASRNILNIFILIILSFYLIPRIFSLVEFIKVSFFSFFTVIVSSVLISNIFKIKGENPYYKYNMNHDLVERYYWLFIHPNIAGMFGMILCLISCMLYELTKEKRYVVTFVASFYMIFLTGSRSSMNIVLMYLVFSLVMRLYRSISKKKLVGAFVFLESVLFTILLIICSFIFVQFVGFAKINSILSGRLEIWNETIQSIHNIFIGEGLFLPGRSLIFSVQRDGHAIDGLYISLLYNEGIIGLLLFLSFSWIIIIQCFKLKWQSSDMVLNVFILILMYSVFESHFWTLNIFNLFVLGSVGIILRTKNTIKVKSEG
ncbi:O-antigen ligase family protein [Priestia megaterium]